MEKTLKIEGMSCGHCSKRVQDALETGLAVVTLSKDVADKVLEKAVVKAGYTVIK